ncbi:MAG: hypothetical protein ACD_41C00188G0006 [uncultured bacterium]|nr:MAG: hypothetical protein ACD_41C00188G0006 [uncultured bacterium]HBY73066.1 hypothetical protein [Candidatus Kerfeldbacteria bacterium]
MNFLPTSSLLLKQQTKLFDDVLNNKIKSGQLLELVLVSLLSLAIFGGVMSLSFPHWWHAMDVMWKLIVLLFGTQILCLPALYVFSSIRGSRITVGQLLLSTMAGIATTAVVLVSLSPIAWFFTWSMTGNIDLLRVMNALMIGLGMLFGIILLARSFIFYYQHFKQQHPENKSAVDILLLWLILVIIVTIQMANKLGPWYIVN